MIILSSELPKPDSHLTGEQDYPLHYIGVCVNFTSGPSHFKIPNQWIKGCVYQWYSTLFRLHNLKGLIDQECLGFTFHDMCYLPLLI